MTTFTSLKKNSGQKSLLELAKAAEKFNKKSGSSDGNFWKPTVDKAENGSAVIRFLPAPGDEDVAFVRYMDYSFKGPGGTYWEKSLKSLGKDDPVAELNSSLYNSTKDETSDAWEQARTQKRRVHYVANIYVISDPGKPENEGKVFLYDFGQKIWDKLNDAMNPEDADETAINPFDLWEGANFRLKIRKVAGYRNYDKSAFDSVGPLLEDDDKLEEIWKQEHSLKEYTDPANYKSYEDLQARLNKVLGVEGKPEKTVPKGGHGDEPAPKKETRKAILDKTPEVEKVDDEDADELAYFRSLANADED